MEITPQTPHEYIPKGYSILYSLFDYYRAGLYFTSKSVLKKSSHKLPWGINELPVITGISKCSSTFLSDIGVIFEKSEYLENNDLHRVIDTWASQIQKWKYGGVFSAVWFNRKSFVQKKSVIIDDCVFFISNSVSECLPSRTGSGAKLALQKNSNKSKLKRMKILLYFLINLIIFFYIKLTAS